MLSVPSFLPEDVGAQQQEQKSLSVVEGPFEALLTGQLENRAAELKGSLNEANAKIAQLENDLRVSRAKEGLLKRAIVGQQQQERAFQQQQPEDGRVQELEQKLKLAHAREGLLKRIIAEAEEKAARSSQTMEVIAAEEYASNEAMSSVVARCIEALKPVLVDEDLQTVQQNPADLIPVAVQTLGEQLLTIDAQRQRVESEYEKAKQLLDQSENECDALQAALDDQMAAVAKMQEMVKQGAAQYQDAMHQNAQMSKAVNELAPLAEYCRQVSDENAKLKSLHAETKEMMRESAAHAAAREEIARKRIEALDSVPTEQLYIEYLERKSTAEKRNVALLLSTLVAKVRLLTTEVVQVRERNRGLMHVILEEARDDSERRAEVEYLSTCLAFKDAIDEQVRWDGEAVHAMEERALLGANPEKIILHASGHVEGAKQKISGNSSSSVREEFNKTLKRNEVERARTERLKLTLEHTSKKLTETMQENTALKIEVARLKEQMAMSPVQRAEVMRLAAQASVESGCKNCVELLCLNRELCDYRRMEDARGADAVRRMEEVKRQCEDKMAEMQKQHRTELQSAAAKRKDAENVTLASTSALRKQVEELKQQVEMERKRTDARIARDVAAAVSTVPVPATATRETLAQHVARQLALSVLHRTWREMQHTREDAAGLTDMLKDVSSLERALGSRVGTQTLAEYVVQVVKQCIAANTAFSRQLEKEKNDTTKMLYALVHDSQAVIQDVLSKVSNDRTPDVPALRRLIAEAGENQEQRQVALSLAFEACATYIQSVVDWIQNEQTPAGEAHSTPTVPSVTAVAPIVTEDREFDLNEFATALYTGENQVKRGESTLFNGEAMKRFAGGHLENGRKKMHKSVGGGE